MTPDRSDTDPSSSPQAPGGEGASALPEVRRKDVGGFGRAVSAPGDVLRPKSLEAVRAVLLRAAERGRLVTLRGAGKSYGDAALREDAVILDLQEMDEILHWDAESGIIEVEPGVTIEKIWKKTLPDGWWPPVVPGTMFPTLAGCLAMNVHGKNNWRRGTVGAHCLELDLMLASGEVRTLERDRDRELFRAVIGSFGQLGVITRIRWQLKRVRSGQVWVEALPVADLAEMLAVIDRSKDSHEYVVGWLDGFPRGKHLGRGQIHRARYLEMPDGAACTKSLQTDSQTLPATFYGVPRALVWRGLKLLNHRWGMTWLNRLRYAWAKAARKSDGENKSLVSFQFLLDYIPHWERAYPASGGLIQHQSFVPSAAAERVFRRQLEICHEHEMPPFLAVLKRHREDEFLLSHAVDGYSLALDFPVTAKNREDLWAMVRELAEPVVAAGGRFYPAKDAALPADLYQATFRDGQLERFARLKEELDPGGLFTSALAERLLGPVGRAQSPAQT